jgi:uncharacterized protein
MNSLRCPVLSLMCLVCVLVCAHSVNAQREQTPGSEGKRQLILELINLINQRTSMEAVVDPILREMESVVGALYNEQIQSSAEYTPEEKEQLIKDRKTISDEVSARFRERLAKEVDFQTLQRDLMLKLYSEYFSEQELSDLVAFYRTPTGQKTLTVIPQLMGESIRLSSEFVGSRAMQISRDVLQEVLDKNRAKTKGKDH